MAATKPQVVTARPATSAQEVADALAAMAKAKVAYAAYLPPVGYRYR